MRWRQRASRRQPSIPAPFLNKYIYITLVCIYRNGWLRRIHSIINSTWYVGYVAILTRSLTYDIYWNSAFPRPLVESFFWVATSLLLPQPPHVLSDFLMDAIIVAHSASQCIAWPTPQLGTQLKHFILILTDHGISSPPPPPTSVMETRHSPQGK